ncbi:hypothetical protein TrCOL_g13422 [Triparma columacea]|uniref:ABM domain-containing protein n=1 Tax=Triparma columacea TaxID=722753 RepID=A0A9W7LA60_9STRA|nr:hypothetical protein TrCOL_g13422 [Triparma columacea]
MESIYLFLQGTLPTMLVSSLSKISARASSLSRPFSTIPVTNVASVLKLNVRDEPTAVKFDSAMKAMTEKMKASPGMISATRHVCKSEWAYELSFVWDTKENFGAWKESALREEVHSIYLDGLKDCGIEEDNVYGGARVSDVWV